MYSVAEVAGMARAMQLNSVGHDKDVKALEAHESVKTVCELTGFIATPDTHDSATDSTDTSAVAVAEYDETDSAEVDAYLNALEADDSDDSDSADDSDSDDSDDSASDSADDSDSDSDDTPRIVIYTTATMGDIPGTLVLDEHAGDFNGRIVRKVAVHEADWDAQRKAYFSQGRIARTEQEWQRLVELTARGGVMPLEMNSNGAGSAEPALADRAESITAQQEAELRTPASAAPVVHVEPAHTETPTATDAPAEQEIPAEILEAERLAAVAREAQRAYQAAQEAMKAAQEAMKVAAAQAAEAKAAAPVLITPEIRAQIDRIRDLMAQGEQPVAKAIRDGLLFMRTGDKAKRDTGTVRKVAGGPNSNGSVDLYTHGSNGTAVNHGSSKVMSEERARLVRQVKELLAEHSDTQIARLLGLEPVKGSKFVWNVRDKVARGVVGYAAA